MSPRLPWIAGRAEIDHEGERILLYSSDICSLFELLGIITSCAVLMLNGLCENSCFHRVLKPLDREVPEGYLRITTASGGLSGSGLRN